MPTNLAAGIYGTITVGSLLAIESAQRESYPDTIAAVLIALFLYWTAHSYAELASRRLKEGESLTLDGLTNTMAQELSILLGASIPLGALLVAWAIGAPLTSAVTAAIWTSASTIVLIEIIAGLRAKKAGRELIAQTAFGALLGIGILGLRLVLH